VGRENRDVLFRPNDDVETQARFADVAAAMEARMPVYRAEAKELFLAGADPWLIAYAKTHGHTLVSQEQGAPNSGRSVKIPDMCGAVVVPCMRTVDLLRALGVRLVQG
jgi:hypothetical protein